ncbi:MAG: HAD family hydrolase [Holophaga sp.]|nr:HAD family hydrolase [Holophaga sp.]
MPTDDAPHSLPALEGRDLAACLGAPQGGALGAPSLRKLLEAVLAAWDCRRVWLSPALLPNWGHRIEDRGGQALVLPADLACLRPAPGDQVWLDLGGPGEPDDAVTTFLDLASIDPGPLVVLMRDNDPRRARTRRLAVDRPGRVLLLRETGATAYALGDPGLLGTLAGAAGWRPGPGPVPSLAGTGGRLLVLDVDGVLIDPGRAFMDAVAGALGQLAPDLPWSDEDYLRIKRSGGFNNDFRLTAAALALAEQGGPAGDWSRLEPAIREWEPRCQVAVREQFRHTARLARPMVAWEQLAAVRGDLAICTGRPPAELASGFELLGFELPAVSDRAPHLRKPRPEGLIQLADAFRSQRIVFVGDSRDDAAALRGARDLRPELDWCFAAVGPGRAGFAREEDLQAAGLVELLKRGDLP